MTAPANNAPSSAIDDPRASSTYLVTIIGTILLLALVVVGQVVMYGVQRVEDERKLFAPPSRELLDLQAQQLLPISRYAYLDQKQGVVAVPIDRAIELFLADLKSGRPPPTMSQSASRPPDTQPTGKPE